MAHLYMYEYLDFHTSSATVIPLNSPNLLFFIRREKNDKERVVNVFSADGTKVYTFERRTPLNPVWNMLTYPSRREVATIRAGFFSRAVEFHNKIGLEHRVVTNELSLRTGRIRSFYLTDGSKYGWTRGTKYLERISNPGGGDQESHERVAKVKLMRQFKFDFEMILDNTKIDPEVALATGFISMLTQWGLGDITETTGPTFVPGVTLGSLPLSSKDNKDQDAEEETKITLVFEGVERAAEV